MFHYIHPAHRLPPTTGFTHDNRGVPMGCSEQRG